jgi:hypothetical protein
MEYFNGAERIDMRQKLIDTFSLEINQADRSGQVWSGVSGDAWVTISAGVRDRAREHISMEVRR